MMRTSLIPHSKFFFTQIITKWLIKKKNLKKLKKNLWKNRSDSRHLELYRFFSFVVVNVIYLLFVQLFSFVTLRFIEFY